MNVPPVYPETGRHEGALLILDVFGVARQSEKLSLRGGNRCVLVGSGERDCHLGDLHLERRRRAVQHRWRDKGVDNRDVGESAKFS
jgi:hypothetical protein